MKKDIHPEFYADARIVCACGNKMNIPSTVERYDVEVCSSCHPFFTGEEKIMDTAGRVEKFKQRMAKAAKKNA